MQDGEPKSFKLMKRAMHRGRRRQNRSAILWHRYFQGAAWHGMRPSVVVTMHKRQISGEICKTSRREQNTQLSISSRYCENKDAIRMSG